MTRRVCVPVTMVLILVCTAPGVRAQSGFPESPALDPASAQALREIVAKGAMPALVLTVDDCRAAYERMRARGVELSRSRWRASAVWTPASAIPRATGGR